MPYRIPRRPSKKAMRFAEAAFAPLIDGGVALEVPERKARAKSSNPEAQFQRALVTWLSHILTAESWFTAIDHGRHDDGGRLWAARMGAKSGVPDILVIHQGHAVWLECKSEKGVVSPAQKEIHEELYRVGCDKPAVVRTIKEAEVALRLCHVPLRGTSF